MTRWPFHRFLLASGLTNLADGVATVAWAWPALPLAVPAAAGLARPALYGAALLALWGWHA